MIRSTPAAGRDVGPPLMCPQTSGARWSRWSGVIGLLPGMLAPPEWHITVMPCAWAPRTWS